MLKKISGCPTKFCFYVRNNFLSFLFKTSVFLTLLVLIYLVCVLKQSNSAQKNPTIEVQQIARSQKLISRVPSKTDSPLATTEVAAEVKNFIPKVGMKVASHPYFPIQEQTTSSNVPSETTSLLPMHDQTISSVEQKVINPSEANTNPGRMPTEVPTSQWSLEETSSSTESINENPIFQFDEQDSTPTSSSDTYLSPPASEEPTSSVNPIETTLFSVQDEQSITQELFSSGPSVEQTTSLIDSIERHPLFPIQGQTTPPMEKIGVHGQRCLPPEDTDTTESIASSPSPPSEEQTTPSTSLEETTEPCPEQEVSAEPTETTNPPVAPFKRSLTLNELRLFGKKLDAVRETTPSLTDEADDEEDDSTTTSFHGSDESVTEHPEFIDIFGTAPAKDDEKDSLLPTDKSSETLYDTRSSDSLFQDDEEDFNALETPCEGYDAEDTESHQSEEATNANSNEDRRPSVNTNPFDFQNNLLNLFNFDHIPATSNIKPNRWPNLHKAPSQQLPNSISQITDPADEVNASPRRFQRFNRNQELNSLLNMRIKDSVSLLQRLFGNFLT